MTKTAANTLAYSYVRMSSQQQIKGDSLRRQLDLSRRYAEKHGLELDESLRDIGVSAWTGSNVRDGALGRFLNLVQSGQIARGSYLLVESLDRLSRERVIDALEPFLSILRAGIIVVTLADNQLYSADSVGDNFTQLIISLTIMARAHEESQTKSKRLKAAHEARRLKAAKGQGRYATNMWQWLDQIELPNGQFEYRPNDNARAVQRIFDLADSGIGQLLITRRLNEEKIPTFRNAENGWQQAAVSTILRNEAVIGTYQPTHRVDGKTVPYGAPIPNHLPAVIAPDLFWRVQRKRKTRYSTGNKRDKVTNLFPSIVSCMHCGGVLRLRDGGSKNSPLKYLVCDNRYRARTCTAERGSIRYDVVEKSILDNITDFMRDPGYDPAQREISRASILRSMEDTEAEIDAISRKHRNLVASLEVADDAETRRDVLAQMKKRNSEIEERKSLLADLRLQLETFEDKSTEINEFGDRLKIERLLWTSADTRAIFESRSRIQKAIVRTLDRIMVNFAKRHFIVTLAGTERAYLFSDKGVLLRETGNYAVGLYNTGTNQFRKELDADGKPIIVAIRPPSFDGTTDIPRSYDENRNVDEETVAAIKERLTLIKRLKKGHKPVPGPINPRLADPDVQRLKAERQARAKEWLEEMEERKRTKR